MALAVLTGCVLAACTPTLDPPLATDIASFVCKQGGPSHSDIDYSADATGHATPEEAALAVLRADPFFLDPPELVERRWNDDDRRVFEALNDDGSVVGIVWVSPAPGDFERFLVKTAQGCCPICTSPSSDAGTG